MLSLVNQQAQKETRKVEPPQPQPRNPRPPPLQNNPRVPPPQIEHDDSTIKRIPPRQQPPQQQQHEVPPQPHQRQGKRRVHFLRKVRFCSKSRFCSKVRFGCKNKISGSNPARPSLPDVVNHDIPTPSQAPTQLYHPDHDRKFLKFLKIFLNQVSQLDTIMATHLQYRIPPIPNRATSMFNLDKVFIILWRHRSQLYYVIVSSFRPAKVLSTKKVPVTYSFFMTSSLKS